MKLFRSMCERCGNVTISPNWLSVATQIYRDSDGADMWMELCPECRAEWERLLSEFLAGGIVVGD